MKINRRKRNKSRKFVNKRNKLFSSSLEKFVCPTHLLSSRSSIASSIHSQVDSLRAINRVPFADKPRLCCCELDANLLLQFHEFSNELTLISSRKLPSSFPGYRTHRIASLDCCIMHSLFPISASDLDELNDWNYNKCATRSRRVLWSFAANEIKFIRKWMGKLCSFCRLKTWLDPLSMVMQSSCTLPFRKLSESIKVSLLMLVIFSSFLLVLLFSSCFEWFAADVSRSLYAVLIPLAPVRRNEWGN